LEIHFVHATRTGLDQTIQVRHRDGQTYTGTLPELAPGHWHVQIQAGDWRIVQSLQLEGD
jgi:hypothetical protein